MMVLVITALFVLAMAFAPERGFVLGWLRRRRMREHVVEEDVLRELAKVELGGSVAAPDLARLLHPTAPAAVEAAGARLLRQRLVEGEWPDIRLTAVGRAQALQLVRSHRLWETYLAEHELDRDAVHREAHRLEHAHEIAEELAESLGQPETDPHGSPIPRPSDG
jgi:Mn-dependent DtxR family transcriptional regulator